MSETKPLDVLFFAQARELASVDRAAFEVPADARVSDVRREIAARFPKLTELLAKSRVALDEEFAADDAPIGDARELAVLPPVSGG